MYKWAQPQSRNLPGSSRDGVNQRSMLNFTKKSVIRHFFFTCLTSAHAENLLRRKAIYSRAC